MPIHPAIQLLKRCLPVRAPLPLLQNMEGGKAKADAELAEERRKSKAFQTTADKVGGWVGGWADRGACGAALSGDNMAGESSSSLSKRCEHGNSIYMAPAPSPAADIP